MHVFPGVEVTSNDGIHFLVYFDIKPEDMASDEWEISKTIKHVREFLSELGIHDSDYFNEETKAKYGVLNNFDEIKKIVEKFEGFIVFSHVKANENGLLRKGFSSDFVNDKIKELYIPFECKKDKINEILGVYPDRALILNTDYHHLEEYDSISPTYIKFGDNPSIKGLKQIMFDPSLRIRYEPIEILHPYIIKMILSSKYFGEMTITFNPYLNVIIGGRGSGKSVIIEIITYLLSKFLDLGDFHNLIDYCKKMDALFDDNDQFLLEFYYEHQKYRLKRIFTKFNILKTHEKNENSMNKRLKQYNSDNIPLLSQFIDGIWQEIDPNTILPLIKPHLFTQATVATIPKRGGQLFNIIEDFSGLSSQKPEYFKNKSLLKNLTKQVYDLESQLENLYSKIVNPEEFEGDITKKNKKIEEKESLIHNVEAPK